MKKPPETHPYDFQSTGRLSQDEVQRIITVIEKNCRNIVDRTMERTSIYVGKGKRMQDALVPRPLITADLLYLGCDLEDSAMKADFPKILRISRDIFSPYGLAFPSVSFVRKSDKAKFFVGIKITQDHLAIEASPKGVPDSHTLERDASAAKPYIEWLARLLGLPIEINTTRSGYTLKSPSGTTLRMCDSSRKTVEINPTCFELGFLRDAEARVVESLGHALGSAEVEKQTSFWYFKFDGVQSAGRERLNSLLRGFDSTGLPVRAISEAPTTWTVRNYKSFADMAIMAKQTKREVGLSFLAFEFDDGLTAKMEISAIPSGKYFLFFLLKELEHAKVLGRLLGLKLKEFGS